jgi:hypothetical protein
VSNYTKLTDYSVKDGLVTGDPDKIVKGTELDEEFNSIAVAIATKADTVSPTFTGSPTAPTASQVTNNTQIATTAYVRSAITAVTSPLGTLATQDSDDVEITGGVVSNTTLSYNNSNVVLSATNVQDALDELCTIPPQNKTTNYTLQATDVGGHISITSGNITVPAGVFSVGDVVVIYNNAASSRNILRASGVTMYWYDGANADRTLLQRGLATLLCVGSNTFVLSGQGVT